MIFCLEAIFKELFGSFEDLFKAILMPRPLKAVAPDGNVVVFFVDSLIFQDVLDVSVVFGKLLIPMVPLREV